LAVVAHAVHQIEDLGHLTHRNRWVGSSSSTSFAEERSTPLTMLCAASD
jgi:hypothetical protein